MGRLDLRDPHRDEDDFPNPHLTAAWKIAYERGIASELADRVREREQGEIPPRLMLRLRGRRTYVRKKAA